MSDFNSTIALAKQLRMECEGTGYIQIPKESLKLICDTLISYWTGRQEQVRASLPKAT
jgi:hypothetical protein